MWDFAVIGGGIAGLSAGAHLSALGRLVLLEAEDTLGYHASGRSAALYEPDYGAPATAALARASRPAFEALEVLSPRGLMLVACVGDEARFEAEARAFGMQELTLAEARARVPILNPKTVSRVGYTEAAKDLDTDRLLQAYARQIRANGGEIRTKARVDALVRTGSGWLIKTSRTECAARILVNAAGAWADPVAALASLPPLGITPFRRSIAQIPPPPGLDVRAWPMLIGVSESWRRPGLGPEHAAMERDGHGLHPASKPAGGRLIVSPAEEDPVAPHDAFPLDEVLAEGLYRYEQAVVTPVTRVERAWAGLRSFAPDRTLVLGPDPLEASFWWCAGQGGQGFLSAPAAGALLAERAGGPPSGLPAEVIRALAPDRLRARA